MAMKCSECENIFQPTKEQKYPCSACDGCKELYCNQCSELSSSEIRCLPLRTRLLKFLCKKCRNYELIDYLKNTINDKDEIINSKNEIIKMLQEKLKSYEEKEKNIPSVSYVDAIKSNVSDPERKTNPPKVIIKPKSAQDGNKTKFDLNQKINLIDLKVGVKQIRMGKSGSVVLSCQTKRETEILEKAVQDEMKDNYNIELTKMRRPRIKISNFTGNMTKEEINECIMEQNEIIGEIKTTYIRKTKRGINTIYCECSANAFQQIMRRKKICIGWERLPVYEDLDIPRCFKCQGFYHKQENCRNAVVCSVCSEEHEDKLCPKEKIWCKNCEISNNKFNTKYNCEHSTLDLTCPSLKYHKTTLQNKTAYADD